MYQDPFLFLWKPDANFFFPQQEVIENEGVAEFVRLMQSSDPHLRLNALWAVKNLLYEAPLDLKREVLDVLTFERIYE